MPKFNINDYELVEDRLKKFYSDYPEGRVYTEVVKISDDGTMVCVRALLYKDIEDINPVSTGIAQETKGQGGFANADAWMENCETSAIGRALANWKYQGSGKPRPSAQEMSKVGGKTSEPAPPKKIEAKEDVVTPPVSASSSSPVEAIKEAGFGDRTGDKHSNGALAINASGLLCPCGSSQGVKYYKAEEKNKPNSPDFRCQAMGNCTAGDTVDGKVFAKSWWMDNKSTPECWKDYAAVANGVTLPKAKSLDEISEGQAPF